MPQMFVLASAISVFVEENPSDPRPQVTRPAPDGRWDSPLRKRKRLRMERKSPMLGREGLGENEGLAGENERLAGQDEALG